MLQRYSRSRNLMARNRAFTPYNPLLRVYPIPGRIATTRKQEEILRQQGVQPVSIESFERHGSDYPATVPHTLQAEFDMDDAAPALLLGATIPIAEIVIAKSVAADKFRVFIDTAMEDTFNQLLFQVTISGVPFIRQQFFTQPFINGMQEFHRRFETDNVVRVIAGLRPDVIPILPFGSISVQLFIDAYQGKFRG